MKHKPWIVGAVIVAAIALAATVWAMRAGESGVSYRSAALERGALQAAVR
jgi:hypothetical protein